MKKLYLIALIAILPILLFGQRRKNPAKQLRMGPDSLYLLITDENRELQFQAVSFLNNYVVGTGGSDADWHGIGTTAAPSDINSDIFTFGRVNVSTNANTHGLRVDSTFQFRPLVNTIFDWQDGSVSDGTPFEGLLFQAPTGLGGSFNPVSGNVFTLANNDVAINDREQLGVIGFGGTNPAGGQLRVPAFISTLANGNWSATNHGTTMDFWVTPFDSLNAVNVATFEPNGRFELDQYVNFDDGAPTSMLWYNAVNKDVSRTLINGSPSNGDGLVWNSSTQEFDWGASGGGGGSIQRYDAGGGAWVTADGVGVTFAKAAGVGTLTIPAGVTVLNLRINGVTADLDGANNFTVRIDNTGAIAWNADVASYIPPIIQVINTASQLGGGPTPALPFVYDEGSTPQVQITSVGSGDLDARIVNLNAFSNWTIVLQNL